MIVSLIIGLIVGSFSGIFYYRVPEKESIVYPGSRCDHCKRPILFYQNIPIISFLLLKGRCSHCKQKIDPFYFLIETLNAFLFLILYNFYGFSTIFFYKAVIYSALITASCIDIKTHIIPDRFYIIIFITSFIFSFFMSDLKIWFLGAAVYGFPILSLYFFSDLFQKEAVGFGDVKLLFALGSFLSYRNLKNLFLFYVILYISAGFFSMLIILTGKKSVKNHIAFAPFISFGVFISEVLL